MNYKDVIKSTITKLVASSYNLFPPTPAHRVTNLAGTLYISISISISVSFIDKTKYNILSHHLVITVMHKIVVTSFQSFYP